MKSVKEKIDLPLRHQTYSSIRMQVAGYYWAALITRPDFSLVISTIWENMEDSPNGTHQDARPINRDVYS